MAGRPVYRAALAAVLIAGAGGAAGADDWRQYRHDERRVGASKDSVTLPLTDIWTVRGTTAPAVWRGRVFFITNPPFDHALVCADERTGTALWRQPLRGTEPLLGAPVAPAVTEDGVVFAYEWTKGSPAMGAFAQGPLKLQWGQGSHFWVRAFDARTGAPLDMYPRPRDGADPVRELVLSDDDVGVLAGPNGPPRGPAAGDQPAWLPALTTPVLLGNELVAPATWNLFRWLQSGRGEFTALAHTPPPRAASAELLRADLLSTLPLAAAPGGIIVDARMEQFPAPGDQKQVLALWSGGGITWHRDIPWRPLALASGEDLIFGIMQGLAANNTLVSGLTALSPATGEVQWVYAPRGLPPAARVTAAVGMSVATRPGAPPAVSAGAVPTVRFEHFYLRTEALVVTAGRISAHINTDIVALDRKTGAPVWRQFAGGVVQSLAASKDHLFVSLGLGGRDIPDRLVALRLEDGKQDWVQAIPRGGSLALANGLLYLNDTSLHVFAPAERTYRMAIDSDRPGDYQPVRIKDENGGPAPEAPPPAAGTDSLADATILRLAWGEPLPKLVQQGRARRAAAPEAPLVLALDWLDSTRGRVTGAPADSPAALPGGAEFARLCGRLAAEIRPAYFDLAPEVNVFLVRYPQKLGEVRALLQEAVEAVHQAAPETKVLFSFNTEVQAGSYGRGSYLPFGKLALADGKQREQVLLLLTLADAAGLTSYPETAFTDPMKMPADTLVPFKAVAGKKPVLVTGLAVRLTEKTPAGRTRQASFLKHLFQSSYWLDAAIVAYPDAIAPNQEAPGAAVALRVEEEARPALAVWRDVRAWKRVDQLSVTATGPIGR